MLPRLLWTPTDTNTLHYELLNNIFIRLILILCSSPYNTVKHIGKGSGTFIRILHVLAPANQTLSKVSFSSPSDTAVFFFC